MSRKVEALKTSTCNRNFRKSISLLDSDIVTREKYRVIVSQIPNGKKKHVTICPQQ